MIEIQQNTLTLSELFQFALKAVNGTDAVIRHLSNSPVSGSVAVLSVGKAATAMMLGAQKCLHQQIHSALVITKDGHCDPTLSYRCLEAGHPIPDQRSLDAGTKLLEFIKNIPPETQLLGLISGGTSALVEVLPEHMSLQDLQKMNAWLLASGLAIEDINRVRQSVSKIKGGKCLEYLACKEVTQLLISDVKNDDPALIGSGLFVVPEQHSKLPEIPGWMKIFFQDRLINTSIKANTYIVASNDMACQAIMAQAKSANIHAYYHGQTLYGDVPEVAVRLTDILKTAQKGIHVWGGETTLALPESPGRGGRNQSLALALVIALAGTRGISVLIGASDGSDGPTDDAGAVIDGDTLLRAEVYPGYASEKLATADAGTFLEEAGVLISTGPTGTNVMDIVIALIE